jgi:hypothetical protein
MHTTKPQGPDITQLNIEVLFLIKQKRIDVCQANAFHPI